MALTIGGGPCQERGEKEPPGWPATLRMGRAVRILYALSMAEKKRPVVVLSLYLPNGFILIDHFGWRR